MHKLLALGFAVALLGACAAPPDTEPAERSRDASAAAAAAIMGYHGPLRREDKREGN